MKKTIIQLVVFIAIILSCTTIFASSITDFKYEGESYNATVTASSGLNLRDAKGNLICAIPYNEEVYVYGISKTDNTKAVVEWNKKVGTVLASYLKKKTGDSTYAYTGESYDAITTSALVFRNNKGESLGTVPTNTSVRVLGIYKNDTTRAVIEWNGTTGTVLARCLQRKTTNSNTGYEYTGESYDAITTSALVFRDNKGKSMGTVPTNTSVRVLGIYKNDTARAVIEWDGTTGTVLASCLKRKTTNNNTGYQYTGESYYAENICKVNLRDNNNNVLDSIPANSCMRVKGTYSKDTSRIVVEWKGKEGTVIKSSTTKIKDIIVVNIAKQEVTLIKNNVVLLKTPCVTGHVTNSPTIKGYYSIDYKQRDYYLQGRYFVKYWMPFEGNYGLHDASWRTNFGGTIYKNDGSHGCVNLPESAAKTIFDNSYAGMKVYLF